MGLGLFIVLLFPAFTGPMPLLTTVTTHIIVACQAFLLLSRARLGIFVLPTAAFAARIPCSAMGIGVGARAITRLHPHHPLLLSKEQTTSGLLGWGWFLLLLDGAG
jgi:hypothetical protein